jgi:hypothetical protein
MLLVLRLLLLLLESAALLLLLVSRARSRTGELGTFLLRTNHLRTVQVFLSAR